MTVQKKILLLIGSPKKNQGASEFMGSHLLNLFNEKGIQAKKEHIKTLIVEKHEKQYFFSLLDNSNVIILLCPLYFDAPPYPVTKAMEIISEHRAKQSYLKAQSLFVISNCGYPEAEHNKTAMALYKQFAKEAKFLCVGELLIGMGPMVYLNPILKTGFLFSKLKKTLNRIANHIIERPGYIGEIVMEPFIPQWVYFWGGRAASRLIAARNGAFRISRRPYVFNR